jgi:hypothetical protein
MVDPVKGAMRGGAFRPAQLFKAREQNQRGSIHNLLARQVDAYEFAHRLAVVYGIFQTLVLAPSNPKYSTGKAVQSAPFRPQVSN